MFSAVRAFASNWLPRIAEGCWNEWRRQASQTTSLGRSRIRQTGRQTCACDDAWWEYLSDSLHLLARDALPRRPPASFGLPSNRLALTHSAPHESPDEPSRCTHPAAPRGTCSTKTRRLTNSSASPQARPRVPGLWPAWNPRPECGVAMRPPFLPTN